jgi:soluble lytic murein transglycosylase-like protein
MIAALVAFAMVAIVSAAATSLERPAQQIISYSSTEQLDLEYIRLRARQQAIEDFYTSIVGNEEIVSYVLAAAEEYNIRDVEILFALMYKESSFRPTAINYNSTSIDRGLFQLNSTVYHAYTAEQLFDIARNIRMGVAHYAEEYRAADKNHQIALQAYNAGRSRRHNPPASTAAYAIDILHIAQRYRDEKNEYKLTVP